MTRMGSIVACSVSLCHASAIPQRRRVDLALHEPLRARGRETHTLASGRARALELELQRTRLGRDDLGDVRLPADLERSSLAKFN